MTETPKRSVGQLIGWIMWFVIVLTVAYFSTTAQIAADDRRREAVVSPELISTDLTGARLSTEMVHSRFGGLRWTVLDTKDWLLINPSNHKQGFCYEVFEDFIAANVNGSGWEFETIDSMLKQHAGTTVQVRVAVPHYKSVPYKLETCPQLAFDAKDGRLKVEGKPVAVWLPTQLGALMPVIDKKLVPGSVVVTY